MNSYLLVVICFAFVQMFYTYCGLWEDEQPTRHHVKQLTLFKGQY